MAEQKHSKNVENDKREQVKEIQKKVDEARERDPSMQFFDVSTTWIQGKKEKFEVFTVRKLHNSTILGLLRKKIQRNVGRHATVKVVFQGKVLEDDEKTLWEHGIRYELPKTHKIFVTARFKSNRQIVTSPAVHTEAISANQIPEVCLNEISREEETTNLSQNQQHQQQNSVNNNNNNNISTTSPTTSTSTTTNHHQDLNSSNNIINQQQRQNNPPQESLIPNHQDQATNHHQEEKLCRICYDTEDNEMGKLISPCKCKGTMKYIHLGCLNEWRQRAVSDKHYYECSQCLYKYNIKRAEWAEFFEKSELTQALSVIVITAVVAICGFLFTLTGQGDFIYDNLEWHPKLYWAHCNCKFEACESLCNSWFEFCPGECMQKNICECSLTYEYIFDIFFFGFFLISFVGLYHKRDSLRWTSILFMMASGLRQFRMFMIFGAGYCYQFVYYETSIVVKKILTRFGEIILEIQEDPENTESNLPQEADARN